jgi:hypothetical protein
MLRHTLTTTPVIAPRQPYSRKTRSSRLDGAWLGHLAISKESGNTERLSAGGATGQEREIFANDIFLFPAIDVELSAEA